MQRCTAGANQAGDQQGLFDGLVQHLRLLFECLLRQQALLQHMHEFYRRRVFGEIIQIAVGVQALKDHPQSGHITGISAKITVPSLLRGNVMERFDPIHIVAVLL